MCGQASQLEPLCTGLRGRAVTIRVAAPLERYFLDAGREDSCGLAFDGFCLSKLSMYPASHAMAEIEEL